MRRFALLVAGLALLAGVAATVSGGARQAEARWVIRDLGTLGGEESEAHAINDRGQVVGFAYAEAKDKAGKQHWHAFLWEKGKMRDLGTLGGPSSEALAINNRGQVVGWADTKATDATGEPVAHAFLWESGEMRDLGTLGGPGSSASGINDLGQIVGRAEIRAKDKYGYPGTHAGRAFLWEKGTMRDLGTFGGPSSGAVAINEHGQVVGSADTRATIKRYGYKEAVTHVFLWQGGRMRDLGTLYGVTGLAGDVNDRGQIVGSVDTGKKDVETKYGDEPIWHAFLWQKGKMRDLTRGGPHSNASGINDSGLIVGSVVPLGWTYSDPADQAVLWRGGKMIRLPALYRRNANGAAEVNARARIVGWSETRDLDRHAVLWMKR